MHNARAAFQRARIRNACRIGWTVCRILTVQSLVCAAAAIPPLLTAQAILSVLPAAPAIRLVAVAVLSVPVYVLFALLLMWTSGCATRIFGWRTPPDREMRISDVSWPLLRWAEYMVAIHVVRFFAGGLLRGTPVWTAYLRLAGARLGRRVYINTLGVSDYNLIEAGDDVVIGADAHVSGHTVESGYVRTARVRLGRGVTVGVGTIVDIGVEAGDGCQVGALSFVPKFEQLAAGGVYAGIPVRRLGGQTGVRRGSDPVTPGFGQP